MNKLGKKIFTVSVVALTIVWSVGVSAFLPTGVKAVDCPELEAGDLFKAKGNPAVFLLNDDLQKMDFFSAEVYYSWYSDSLAKEGGVEVDGSCLDNYNYGGTVSFRPGSRLVKGPSAAVYTMLPDGSYKKIANEAAAVKLFGSKWYTLVRDVTEGSYFSHFTKASGELDGTELVDGMLVKTSATGKVYSITDGMAYEVDGTLPKALVNDVRTVTTALLDSVEMADETMTPAEITADPAMGLTNESTGTGTTVPTAAGSVTVSLAASTPAATNLADGTSFNPLLKFTLSAGKDGATVKGVTLKKGGFTANTNVTGIDIIDGNDVRHGNVASTFNSDAEVTILFGSSPVVVPANGSVTLTARVNLSASANSGTIKLTVKSLDTTATVAGVPVTGNEFTVVDGGNSVASTTLGVEAISGTSGTTLNADSENSQEITKFRISENASKEDILVYSLRLFNYGNAADADYKDVQLVATDGTVLATAQPSAQYVTFDMSAAPYRILKGQFKDLTVRAKIVGGTSKTIHFVVYNDYDLVVKGADTGAYVLATVGSNDSSFPVGDGSSTTWNKVEIGTGSLTFNKSSDSPSVAVAPGASNVVLAKYYMKAVGEDMEVRKLSFGIEQDDSALTGNVSVKVDGANVWSGAASTFVVAGTAGSVTLTSYPLIKAGVNSYITVEANVPSTATSGVYYKVKAMDVTEVKKLISNTLADPTVGTADGNQISVNAVSLSAKTLSTPVAQSLVAGTTEFTFAQFEFDATNSGEDVRIASFVVSDSSNTSTEVTNLRIYMDGSQLTTSNSTVTGQASTTFSLNNAIVLKKGTKTTITLKGDVMSGSETHTFRLHSVSATGKDTGTTASVSPTGNGQAMTIAAGPTVVLALESGTGKTPTVTQVVNIGSTDGVYFAFRVNAQNEAIKLRTLKLTAVGTSLSVNDVKNIRVYRESETTPFATMNEMTVSSTAANNYVATWTATDNILSSTINPGSPVTFYVKADVGTAGQAKLGNNFLFKIANATTDFVAVGATNSGSASVTGSPAATTYNYIVPQTVKVEAVSPLAAQTVGLSAGANIGVFKVTNLGAAAITLTKADMTDNGSSTSTMLYKLFVSTENENNTSGNSGNAVSTTVAKTTTFGTLTPVITINGGSSVYLTVKTQAAAENYNNFQMSISSLGGVLYSVTDTALGYDGNVDGDIQTADVSASLYVDGKPAVETVTARS